ncbi:MAG: hypothetical protein IPL58_16680 [Betaproteobacteria bacterium]|uniref:Uncharacterized protein n=1 Tax=Candidatus Proximibacter danicus TaxID=2954365 RepID=A0A9D7K322_9PROT|nr:hypothetical protein [Candidatus Proximibacter danicus]
MQKRFDNFKTLYNNGTSNAVVWDINQLQSEQKVLQPVHEKYLSGTTTFRFVSSIFTDTNIPVFGPGNNFGLTDSKQGQPGGVKLLDYKSRVEFGCRLLGYNASQGCNP